MLSLPFGRGLGLGDGLDDGEYALRVAAHLAALEARRMHRHDMDPAAGKLGFKRPVAVHDAALDIVADDLRRAGGDDGDHAEMGIAPRERHHACLHALMPAEHRRILVQRGRGDVEILFEMLREQKPHEHRAALAAVNERYAVLDADAGILGAGRLAVIHRVDDACPFLVDDFATHGDAFRMDRGRPASGPRSPLSRANGSSSWLSDLVMANSTSRSLRPCIKLRICAGPSSSIQGKRSLKSAAMILASA